MNFNIGKLKNPSSPLYQRCNGGISSDKSSSITSTYRIKFHKVLIIEQK